MSVSIDAGSFRDPRGRVLIDRGRVLRTVTSSGIADYKHVRDCGLYEQLISQKRLVGIEELDPVAANLGSDVEAVLEHPRIPMISYPYEWGFELLKKAAIFQLEVYLEALRHNVTLTDASAYNVQFVGTAPIFIDHLAFRKYVEGEYWMAHRQFCEQFLNPLLLRSAVGIPHNAWYRGALEGITTSDLGALLPLREKLSWNILLHVVLQAHFQKASLGAAGRSKVSMDKRLPKASFERMLIGLRDWIEKLRPKGSGKSVWSDYANDNTYSSKAAEQKAQFIRDFVTPTRPQTLWDLGCNTGHYSEVALGAGAEYVVGFDFDHGAIDKAERRATERNLAFLPLVLDATNPTPDQGWGQVERKGLVGRADAEGLLALALVHHLAIGKNVPLPEVVDWLFALAPRGVVEFVPKSDPMVKELLRFREDIFATYDVEHFKSCLLERGRIVRSETVQQSERELFWFERS
jgi:ribosomal protein L11 methylase PrmA